MNTQLIPGKTYKIIADVYPYKAGRVRELTTNFIQSFPCYDGRHHGVGNPADFIVYQFLFDMNNPQYGTQSFYAYQIHSIMEVN